MEQGSILSRNIRIFREQAGLTQDELSKILGNISRSTVASWETGNSSPDVDQVPRLAEALNVTIEELFMGVFKASIQFACEKNSSSYNNLICDFLSEAGPISAETAERCRKAIADELAARSKPALDHEPISFPLFLTMRNDDYFEMKEKATLLRKLKRQHYYSFSEIREYLNSIDIDYDEHICLAYLYLLFFGEKVPSRQLYERLYVFLSKPKNHK